MASCACACTGRALIWFIWGINTFLSIVYIGLSLTSFNSVRKGTDRLVGDGSSISTLRNGLLASCMLGFLIVLCYMVYSFLILFLRLFGDLKLWYGIMLGATLNTAWFMILAGLVLQNSNSLADQFNSSGVWSDRERQAYTATYVFNYILVASFLITFFTLFFGRKYLGRTELAAPPAAGTNLPPPANNYVDMQNMGNKGTQV